MIEKMLEAVNEGRNILITGGAGTGKSYNIRKIIEWAESEDINIARTALTGMASLQFDCGETLHRCLGLGFNKNVGDLNKITRSYIFRTEKRWEIESIDIIIIDEISMLRSDTLELCNAVFQYVMDNDEPFGGKQVIFSGDFMQLPPIVRPEEKNIVTKPWAFQSELWEKLELEIIYLTEIKRQDDPQFAQALNTIRAGAAHVCSNYFEYTRHNKFPEGVTPTKLLSTNMEVNRVND